MKEIYLLIGIKYEGNKFIIEVDHHHEATPQEENNCPPLRYAKAGK